MATMKRRLQWAVPVLALTSCNWLDWCRASAKRRACLHRFRTPRRFLWAKPLGVAALALILSGCGFFGLFDVSHAIAQTSGLTYPIVDTNQTETYDNSSEITAPPRMCAVIGMPSSDSLMLPPGKPPVASAARRAASWPTGSQRGLGSP